MIENSNEQIEQEYDKCIQDSIDMQNFFLDLLSSDIDLNNSDLSKLLETEDQLKIFNILQSFNYTTLWYTSQVSRAEKIFDFIFPIIKNKSIISNEQLKYEIFSSRILKKKVLSLLSPIFQIISNLNDLPENEKNNEYNDNKIFEIIRKDDFVEFQDIVSHFDIDLDGEIKIPHNFEYKNFFKYEYHSIFDRNKYIDDLDDDSDDILLSYFDNRKTRQNFIYKGKFIEIAAFFGSISIFKFLWMNKVSFNKEISKFMIAGGNYEIIHLLEDYITYSPEDLTVAVQFHRNEIFEYIMNNNDFKFNENDMKTAVESNNLEFLVNNVSELNESHYIKSIDNLINLLFISIENKNAMIFIFLFNQYFQNLKNYEKFSLSSLLKRAIKEKSFEIVKFLISIRSNIANDDINDNLKSDDLIKGTGEMMKYILSKVDNKLFTIDSTLMCKASEDSVVEVVEFIDLKCNHFKNADFKNNETPFHCACLAGNFCVIEYLANAHKEWIEMKDENGVLPIHQAVLSSRLEIVKYLIIVLNTDCNAVSNENKTPLYYAVEYGHADIVNFLCSLKNIDINIKSKTDTTPLELAINKKKSRYYRYFKRKRRKTKHIL